MENTFGKNIIPDNDHGRLAALKRYQILDTPPEDAFDRIATLATKIFRTPVSLISLVDDVRVFFKANIGAGDEREASRGESLCALAVLSPEVLVFENAPEDPCLLANPNVAAEHGLKFYAGAPLITPDNYQIGTLCIVDFTPRQFSEEEKAILKDLSSMVMHEIELRSAATGKLNELSAANEELSASIEELTQTQESLQDLNEELEERIKQRTEAAVADKHRLEAMIMNTPIAMAILKGDDLVVEVANQPMLDVWRRTLDQVVNRGLVEIFPELKGQPNPERMRGVMRTGQRFSLPETEVILGTINGELKKHYARFSYDPIADTVGTANSILVTVINITEEVLNRQQLQQASEEMAALNEELKTSNEELSESREQLQNLVVELADSESKTRNIVEAAPFPIGVYTGREMRVMFANPAILDAWGKGSDVIGKLYAEILPELAGQQVFQQLESVYTTGIAFEARNQRIELIVDGEPKTYYFNYNFTPLHNEAGEIYGIMNTAADVTDVVIAKQQVEQASDALFALNEELAAINEELTAANEEQNAVNHELAELNEKYKQTQDELHLAINAAGLGTFDLNPATGHFSGNELLKSWFGLAPDADIELSKATDVIAAADRERVIAAINQSLTFESGGDYDIQYTITEPANPAPRIVRAKGKALFNESLKPVRFSGVLQDVTEQSRDDQRKNDFIGMVSHELKTPLTSLTAIVQVLNVKLKTSEDSFVAGALDKANIQVKKMSTMINGFLNISRLESGKIQMDKKEFNLEELIESIISETKLISTGHDIGLSNCVPTPVFADQDKIGSVISNLLSNAVKYSPKGTHIEISCQTKPGSVEVSVHDEGMGVKSEDQKHLFDRYYRVDNPNYRHISGFGIGLYLSSEIIHQHGGKIWVESLPGQGSTFYFSLPVHEKE